LVLQLLLAAAVAHFNFHIIRDTNCLHLLFFSLGITLFFPGRLNMPALPGINSHILQRGVRNSLAVFFKSLLEEFANLAVPRICQPAG
jgi:hypothetical protein